MADPAISTPTTSTWADPVAHALAAAVRSAGGNGLTLAALEAVCIAADPGLATAPDRRGRLAATIDTLRAADVLRCPSARRDWDRSGHPALPAWVRPPLGTQARSTATSAALPGHLRAALTPARALEPLRPAELEVLTQVNAWLVARSRTDPGTRLVVPHRERALEIFGDEKALDALIASRLFTSGVLSLDLLCCLWVPPQLVWRRVRSGTVALVVENADTYRSVLAAVAVADGPVAVVAYGAGNAFTRTVAGLADPELADGGGRGINEIRYFGDLDATGLAIPQRAAAEAQRWGLPAPIPATGLYGALLTHGHRGPGAVIDRARADELTAWLGDSVQAAARDVVCAGKRLAQEAVGRELLHRHPEVTQRP